MHSVTATEFKAKCLAIMDDVANTGQGVLITKRGKPIAKIVPTDTLKVASPIGMMAGTCETLVDEDELLQPILAESEWNALQ